MPANTYTWATGRILRRTGAAIQFKFIELAGHHVQDEPVHWIPLSQIDKLKQQAKGAVEQDEILVADWILKKKELV